MNGHCVQAGAAKGATSAAEQLFSRLTCSCLANAAASMPLSSKTAVHRDGHAITLILLLSFVLFCIDALL